MTQPQQVQVDESLLNEIAQEVEVDCDKALRLYHGLYDALDYHENIGNMYYSETTITDYKREIKTACAALKDLNSALAGIPEKDRKVLDSYYCEANEQDMLMFKVSDEKFLKTGEFESGFHKISRRMKKALDLAKANINSPGAGGASRTGKKYIAAIEMLARWFSDTCPENKLSAMPNTPFYKYVQIWFKCFVDPNKNDKDIRRHISNTLKHPNVRLHHVKGRN